MSTLTKDDQPRLQDELNIVDREIKQMLEEKKGIEHEITALRKQQGNPGASKGNQTNIKKKNERIITIGKEIQEKRQEKNELAEQIRTVEKMQPPNAAHREVWNEFDDVSGQNAYIPLHINHGYNDYNQYHAVNALGGSYNEHSSVEYLLLSAVFFGIDWCLLLCGYRGVICGWICHQIVSVRKKREG
eukprot:313048_1